MKLFKSMVEQKRPKGDETPVKVKPILLVAENVKDATDQLNQYWGKQFYKWSKPNMISDFNPR